MSSTALTGERQTQAAELLPSGQTVVQSPVLAPIDQLPVADDGEFSSTKVVRANDRRLADARTPIAHRHTAEDITQTEDRRFVSAAERGVWNAHLSETDPHGDRAWAADPSHLTQDSTHRFVSDAEKAAWNAKAVELPIGVPGGAAPLNEFGQVPASYLPPRSASDYATAYLGREETAVNADKLGGKSADEFAGKIHAHDELYLGKTAKATSAGDADKLGGKPASDYATQADLAGLTPGGGTGGTTEGAWTLVRNPNDYLQSLAVGATGRCIQCETGNVGQVGGLPWAWAGVVPAMAGAPVSPAYLYILRASGGQASHHAYARVHVTGALEIIEHGASVDDYRVWRVADFVGTWLTEPRAMQIACAPGVHPVVQILNGATWTTVAGVEESVGTAPEWGLATLSTGQHVQAYDWPAGRCPLGAILIGSALNAAELAAWAASGRWPYWVEAGGSAVSVPVGTLTLGRRYYIAEYTAGDDFTNCGAASNAAGSSFIATGASPTVWAGSRLVAAGAVSIPQVQSGVAALPDVTENNKAWGMLGLVKAVGRAMAVAVFVGLAFESLERFEDYLIGEIATLSGGVNWGANGMLIDYSFRSCVETFEDYPVGELTALSGGSGFAAPATLTHYPLN